jgi:Na+/proline symporter
MGKTSLKTLMKSKRAQTDIAGLSQFAVALLVVGIVVVVAFLITGSFQTTLNKNGEATAAVNTTISNVNSAFSTIASLPPIILVVATVIIISIAVVILKFKKINKGENHTSKLRSLSGLLSLGSIFLQKNT